MGKKGNMPEGKTRQSTGVKKRITSIKLKLLGSLLPAVIAVFAIILLLLYQNTSKIVLDKSEELLELNTNSVVNQVMTWMGETIAQLDTQRDALQYFHMDGEEELSYIKHTADQNPSYPAGIYIGDIQGNLIHASFVPGPEYDINEKSWYIQGLESEEFKFGEAYFDESSQSYVVAASGMLKDQNGNVRGVAAADVYLTSIGEIAKQVQIEKTGGIFLTDTATGIIIGHKDEELLGVPLGEQQDKMYTFVKEKIQGQETGLIEYHEGAEDIYLDITMVPGSSWAAVAYVPYDEVLEELNNITRDMIMIAGIGVMVLIIFMERLIQLIIKPIKKISGSIAEITDGDFSRDVIVKSNDEIGNMAKGLQHFISTMRVIIEEITGIAEKMEEQSKANVKVSESLYGASNVQSQSMKEMNRTVNELASSIMEVAESAGNLSHLIADAQDQGDAASGQMQQAVSASELGMKDMKKVVSSMGDISAKIQSLEEAAEQMDGSIGKINSIVELIRDIAEETNLLSLNASIEAARAGEAGKGFAVVADQIGSLAKTSRDAVDDIAELTQEISGLVGRTVEETRDSAGAIKESTAVVNETGKSFENIYESVNKTDTVVESMVSIVKQVNDIAMSVAGITEEQSAASEEILATTENIRENADIIYENSESVAEDAKLSKKNSEELNIHMAGFKK